MTALDSADELACLRDRFNLPPGLIRLDGNSGGPLPRTTTARLREFVTHRRDGGPRSGENWRLEAQRAAGSLAPLIGARPNEITVAESTSIHLFNALVASARLRPQRRLLVVGRACFPADHYIARSAAEATGTELRLVTTRAEVDHLLAKKTPAVVALAHIDGLSGGVRDAAAMTAEIHRHGALALWELSDSAGALDVDLHAWNTDFALGSGVKYLGGGPGAPAYSYVAQRHQDGLAEADPALACESGSVLDSALGVTNPSTLSMSALRGGLSILDGVAGETLEAKAKGLVALFVGRMCELRERVEVIPLAADEARGPQVSLRHPDAQRLADALFTRGVVVDFREPDVLRFHFAPAWLRYVDVWEACERLHEALAVSYL